MDDEHEKRVVIVQQPHPESAATTIQHVMNRVLGQTTLAQQSPVQVDVHAAPRKDQFTADTARLGKRFEARTH
jgi:hypothetical protein